jgi:hypothetical protein
MEKIIILGQEPNITNYEKIIISVFQIYCNKR